MKSFVLAAILVAALGRTADAQPPLTPLPPPTPPTSYTPRPTVVIPNPPRYTAWPVVVNGVRYYPFDSGEYALAGFDGLGRVQGYFVMGPATAAADPVETSVPHGPLFGRPGCTLRIGSFCR